jgi:glycolate oxidase FAD binding subunit
MADFYARDEQDVVNVIAAAVASGRAVDLIGGGSRAHLGHPAIAPDRLHLGALSGVIDYQPGELILIARAATPLCELADLLAAHGQLFAFEPQIKSGSTLGGALMVGCAGSRRPFAGAARDHFLGFHAVSGRAEAFKAGGNVVKNVTGYDLPKLFAGSFGTLGAVSRVTVKVMPAPEVTKTLAVPCTDFTEGFARLRAIMRGDYDVSGLALLPGALSPMGRSALLIRLEGTLVSVTARRDQLVAREGLREATTLDHDPWAELGHGLLFQSPNHLWQISVPPDAAPKITAIMADQSWYADWAGGRIFWRGDDSPDAGAGRLRAALAGTGHATIIRAPDDFRGRAKIFEPLPAPLAALTARVKAQFDPRAILNPGRMGGI